MKKYFFLLFLALTSLNLISCSVEEKTVQIQLAELVMCMEHFTTMISAMEKFSIPVYLEFHNI